MYTGKPLAETPPVIVGGTDGSGTRGAVALLLSLGVLMLSDGGGADGGCQYDVHGKELHPSGWPPLVQRVLASSHAANYRLENLPVDVRRDTVAALQKMGRAFRTRVATERRRPENKNAVRWGFKAPVSVYLLPFWAAVFPNATFVHVVRDGRDVAFHWLQSPVKRYWPHLFPDELRALAPAARAETRLVPPAGSYVGRAYVFDQPAPLNAAAHFRAAELWQATNLQAQAAGARLAAFSGGGAASASSRSRLEAFTTVRSEDFVTTNARYFEASAALRAAVRPDLTDRALCCVVAHHWQAEQASPGWRKNVANYGKWRGAVAAHGGPGGGLYAGLLRRAGAGLARFGYLSDEAEAAGELAASGELAARPRWDYGAAGAVDCAAVLAAPCPAAGPHKQKCLE